jgi:hypothetical protein
VNYTEDILRKIKNFGYLQYSIDRIISILNPEVAEQFEIDLKEDSHPACVMYQSGLNTGKYNLDAQEFELKRIQIDSEKMELERKKRFDTELQKFLGYGDN